MARDRRFGIGYMGWMLSPVSTLGPPLDSCASVVAVRCRGVGKLVEHDVQDVGYPGMCWTPTVARPGS
jgi:hypothetical protein